MGIQSKKHAVIDQNQCVACGSCVLVCPLSTINIKNGSFAEVDDSKCVGCGKCSTTCPASVIKIEVRR